MVNFNNDYVNYFKRRYYTIVSESGDYLIFDLLDVQKPISFFYYVSEDRIDIERFNKYLIDFVPCEIEDIVDNLSNEDELEAIILTKKQILILKSFLLRSSAFNDKEEYKTIYDIIDILDKVEDVFEDDINLDSEIVYYNNCITDDYFLYVSSINSTLSKCRNNIISANMED